MHRFSRSAALPVIIAVAALAGCSHPSVAAGPPPPAHVKAGQNGAASVVLTPLGARQAGIQTAVVTPAAGGQAVVPYSALLYQPDGSSVIYTVTGPLTYTLVRVTVTGIQGDSVYVIGPAPGTTVVTVGGEELLGVQDGVEVQT